jgi:hypothetical protein
MPQSSSAPDFSFLLMSCSDLLVYQQLEQVWIRPDLRMPLTEWYFTQLDTSSISARIGQFLLARWSRKRPWRKDILTRIASCEGAVAETLVFEWLNFTQERQELRLFTASLLRAKYPEKTLTWLIKHAHWHNVGELLSVYSAQEIIAATLERWMGKTFDARVAQTLAEALSENEYLGHLSRLIETNSNQWIQAWAIRALCQAQAAYVPDNWPTWLGQKYIHVPLAALAGLKHYPQAVQITCLAQTLRFNSKNKPYEMARSANNSYWKTALNLIREGDFSAQLQTPLLELIEKIKQGGLCFDAKGLVESAVYFLLQHPTPEIGTALVNLLEEALARKLTDPALSWSLLSRFNQFWPDWPVPIERVIPWLQTEWSRLEALLVADAAFYDLIYQIQICDYVCNGLLKACLRHKPEGVNQALFALFLRLEPMQPELSARPEDFINHLASLQRQLLNYLIDCRAAVDFEKLASCVDFSVLTPRYNAGENQTLWLKQLRASKKHALIFTLLRLQKSPTADALLLKLQAEAKKMGVKEG